MFSKNNSISSPKDLQFWKSYDDYTLGNPHAGDPRCLQSNHFSYCKLRYTMYCRCCRELGEDDPRCKYQYYRAELSCTQDFLDLVNKHREEGSCSMDTLPSRQFPNMSKYRISLFENYHWNTPSPEKEEEILNYFSGVISELSESTIKKQILFGVNDVTKALENKDLISLVILFRPNIPTTMIRHIPLVCQTKKIAYMSFLKNSNCLAIKYGGCDKINSIILFALKKKI